MKSDKLAQQEAAVLVFSAAEDEEQNVTAAIQRAIDIVHARGGGRVYMPPGRYQVGSLELKSGVDLHLEAGAVFVGSREKSDYTQSSILWARNAHDIAVSGRGCIEGAGSAFADRKGFRPHNIHFESCTGVRISEIQLTKSASWMQRYSRCDDVFVRGIRVFNFDNYNADGIDFVSCRNVMMSDCVVYSGDDGFCLKTETDHPCENVTVTNCIFGSHCNAIKIGTESYGDFRNINISNCVVVSPPCDTVWNGCRQGRGGIDLCMVDGGTLDNVVISNISIRGILCPLFLRLGNRGSRFGNTQAKPTGKMGRIVISNIQAVESGCMGCEITGLEGHPVRDVTLDTIRLSFRGGGPLGPEGNGGVPVVGMPIPEFPEKYPNPGMHGCLPCYGLFLRHVEGLSLRNLEISCEKPEPRTAILMDDVSDVRMLDLKLDAPSGEEPLVRMDRAHQVRIERLTARPEPGSLLIGENCQDVYRDGREVGSGLVL